MPDRKPQIETVVSDPPFSENCYLAWFEGESECIVVDPGPTPERILEAMVTRALSPAAILITHGHADHIAGNELLKQEYPAAPIVIGRGDAEKLTSSYKNLSAGFGLPFVSPEADKLLDHGDLYEAAGWQLAIRDTPGHSAGHIVFIWEAGEPTIVFGGDVLFAGGVGRTDFPDGSFDELKQSIHEQLFTLPDDTVILPGHGPPTTIGEEKRTNPFVGQM